MSNPPVDHVIDDQPGTSNIEDNVKSRSTWLRLVFIVVFGALFNLVALLLAATVVISFLYVLFTGETNSHLKKVGNVLAAYFGEVIRYLTFNTDTNPFPFESDLPKGEPE